MYDTLADEEEFRDADAMIGRFAATLDQTRPYTTREFLYLLGKELARRRQRRRHRHGGVPGRHSPLLPGSGGLLHRHWHCRKSL